MECVVQYGIGMQHAIAKRIPTKENSLMESELVWEGPGWYGRYLGEYSLISTDSWERPSGSFWLDRPEDF